MLTTATPRALEPTSNKKSLERRAHRNALSTRKTRRDLNTRKVRRDRSAVRPDPPPLAIVSTSEIATTKKSKMLKPDEKKFIGPCAIILLPHSKVKANVSTVFAVIRPDSREGFILSDSRARTTVLATMRTCVPSYGLSMSQHIY